MTEMEMLLITAPEALSYELKNTAIRVLQEEVERLKNELAMAQQVSGELCEKCGWAMRFPNELCRCELQSEVERLKSTVNAVGKLLSNNGCDCDCECVGYSAPHGSDCEPCLACRIDSVVGSK